MKGKFKGKKTNYELNSGKLHCRGLLNSYCLLSGPDLSRSSLVGRMIDRTFFAK